MLEGSVHEQGDQVRVNAGLLRASDGMRLWADSYDGKLDDIFAIQHEIGAAIAGALQRKLVRAPALSGPLVTKGEAYDLYLTARSLIRTRNRRIGPTAADLLRDSIQFDKGYAPAWASLAEATQLQGALGDRETFIAALRKADGYARHAVALAPELAEAHRALGLNQPYGDPVGIAHLHRAAELVPNDAENQFALAAASNATGEFEREFAAYRRAHEIDPLWFRTTGALALAMAARGDRAEAEALARRGLPEGANQHNLLGRIADLRGLFGGGQALDDCLAGAFAPMGPCRRAHASRCGACGRPPSRYSRRCSGSGGLPRRLASMDGCGPRSRRVA